MTELPALKPRDMLLEDLDGVVELHRTCFAEYFLTGLGPRVIRCFYRWTVEDPRSVATVLEEPRSGRIVGLAVGTLNPSFHTRLMRRHFPLFAWSALYGLCTRPAVRNGLAKRLGFLSRLFRPKMDDTLARAGIPPARGCDARFLDVAVHADWRGGRNAERLVEYFASRVFEQGAGRVGGTVRPQNLGSLILYKRLGWNVKKTGPDRVDVWVERAEG